MDDRELTIAVSAETVPDAAAGISYFLLNAVKRLATARPSWRFKVVASSRLAESAELSLPNIETLVHDESPLWRSPAKLVRRVRGVEVAEDDNVALAKDPVARSAGYEWARSRWGRLKTIWKSLDGVDAVWVSHYAISGSSYYSLMENTSLAGAPLLFTLHDVHPVYYPEDWPETARDRFWNELVPFARRSSRVITHSEFQRRAITGELGIDPRKVAVVHCPPLLDPDRLVGALEGCDVDGVLSRFGIERPFALFPASNTHTHKNHTRLILAWHELRMKLGSRCPMLVSTAKGHFWPPLKALIEALELEDIVRFTDTVEIEELAALYRGCEFVTVPSRFEGGGSGPVAEGIIMGKPVLCSRIPPIEEQLEAYGCEAEYFSADSVEDILAKVESAFGGVPGLEARARRSQERLVSRIDWLWDELAAFYIDQIRAVCERRPAG